ncbi:MAG: Monoglucosyldiacylglycerol epimerase [Chroococcidiopsis cubana SAG 39.79]|uniref:NAD-dependent epimerase/dehydratase domain-containing protein n=1 Tax=Chroococcidiopsis cubana SAG 39.79 TaxID=388085 RepID=A0AB37UCX8_9CYAN|nr:bifunctional sterol desaturase/short chain dehydrogenase [Chroococcidiopsis cubana]MDZ4877660.1 Monoglucosyldiacylglycerol epimerase [Chroococcidiopsis cubana SAG 39.79]PSB63552.1 sterol desaturase [Chroococcidiopsis cubana CCALA 043]RUT04559.1 hypothetical protein DSM107010_57390 [Chroococcidiopsis cubana SAG 39.79]
MFFSNEQIIDGLTLALTTVAWAAGSIILVELVRDAYHMLSHQLKWLYQQHHIWHHKAFHSDLSIVSEDLYRRSHWHHDVPESILMFVASCLFLGVAYASFPSWATLIGTFAGGIYYTTCSVVRAVAGGMGWKWANKADPNHEPGQFLEPPTQWIVNKSYHWRHHFENPQAYFSGVYTFVDKLLGTAVSLQGKTVAVTGASGALGQALLKHLIEAGARVIALTSSQTEPITLEVAGKLLALETISWQIGREQDLSEVLERADILVLNHGVNVHKQRTQQAAIESFEVNTWSSYRLLELFLSTVRTSEEIAKKEAWVVTSEAEVAPAQSPLYELSKRSLGDLVTLRRLDAPCTIRKILLGGFRSKMSPTATLSADWVAKQTISAVKRDIRNVIVSYRFWIYIVHPVREFLVSSYFRTHSCRDAEITTTVENNTCSERSLIVSSLEQG